MRYAPTHGITPTIDRELSRGIRPAARLPFLPLMEEKEAKEDQGDDRHQVNRMGAGSRFSLHKVQPNRCRKLFQPS